MHIACIFLMEPNSNKHRPLTSQSAVDDWEAETSVLLQFVGAHKKVMPTSAADEQERVLSVVTTLTSRVKEMSVKQREDLYGAMRRIVKMAESEQDADVAINTFFNCSPLASISRRNSVEELIMEFQEEEARLIPALLLGSSLGVVPIVDEIARPKLEMKPPSSLLSSNQVSHSLFCFNPLFPFPSPYQTCS